ncbi:zinc-binding dehydrogenase [Nocardia amamiensis]|uniref:Zinc-binding dehydrogenase n=1 Tax=Nocardia amamiensis TaxID=404578 RepID=A0ABS0CZF6_9NOCA|nr:zinc-binding dehydrogenase [Nocardia amamiensis]MBF6301981.1 zinc-binding dehydrogenase [Nocardia amamiensis]
MYAIRQSEFGAPEQLAYELVPDPAPGPRQALIEVRAAGVHLVDTVLRSGDTRGSVSPPRLPMTPGREVAGVVTGLGDEVDERWLGRRVVVHLGAGAGGGYAELAVADTAALHEIPEGAGYEAAVAMVGTGRMAMGILHHARLVPADVVLVNAAAGGIGNLLVQAAIRAGATVAGAAGGERKVERIRRSGAVAAVDYIAADWPHAVRAALGDRAVSVVFDGVGGAVGRAAFDLLGAGGRVVSFGWSAGEPLRFTSAELFERQLTAVVALGASITGIPDGLRGLEERALAELAAGRLLPAVQTFSLWDAAAAHTALEQRTATGKVVLVP